MVVVVVEEVEEEGKYLERPGDFRLGNDEKAEGVGGGRRILSLPSCTEEDEFRGNTLEVADDNANSLKKARVVGDQSVLRLVLLGDEVEEDRLNAVVKAFAEGCPGGIVNSPSMAICELCFWPS